MEIYYKWIVIQNGEIIRHGIADEPIEIDVEKIFPKANSDADRNLAELQEYADKYLSEHKYIFRYKQIGMDFSDLKEEG